MAAYTHPSAGGECSAINCSLYTREGRAQGVSFFNFPKDKEL